VSGLGDGSFLVTSSQRQQFFTAPGIVVNRLVGAGLDKLIEFHLQKLAELPLGNSAKKINSTDEMYDICDRYEKHSRNYGLQRGIYVLMNDDETAAAQQHVVEAKTMAAGNDADVGVLIELNKLQNRKSSWTGMILLFIVSLILFIGAGTRRWSMNYLAILAGVVFVHELGHYLAMRIFNYKNVQMFFIPFVGAAVTGRHFNVPGWKKAVVSLMGPLPGIYLALLVGGVGWYLHMPILFKIALVSLALNGFNLLPILPLDGGWIFHTLVFSRHYMLDVVFRVLAAIILIVAATFLKTKSLILFGILTLITIPVAYRVARIVSALKQRGLQPVSEDNQTIPPDIARVIIAEVRQSTKIPQANKNIAQQTLQIFEMLNARPPGAGGTMSLLFVQCASIAVAFFFAAVFFVGQNWAWLNFLNTQKLAPNHKLVVEESQSWPAGSDSAVGSSSAILVGTFRDSDRATIAFEDFTNRLPSGASLKLFGESLLLSLPQDDSSLRQQWFGELKRRASDAFEEDTNSRAAFSLSCVASDTNAAEALLDELNDYFDTLPADSIIPPWQPGDARTPSEKAANDLARQTWLKFANVAGEVEANTNLEALEFKMDSAEENGPTNLSSILSQLAPLKEKLYRQNVPQFESDEQGRVDTNMINLFIEINSGEAGTNQNQIDEIRREAAERMGQVARTDHYCAWSGAVERKGLTIKLSYISFRRNDDGPPALASWLRDKGCDDFKYIFLPGMGGDGADGE
jgi:Zn-dependent protease